VITLNTLNTLNTFNCNIVTINPREACVFAINEKDRVCYEMGKLNIEKRKILRIIELKEA